MRVLLNACIAVVVGTVLLSSPPGFEEQLSAGRDLERSGATAKAAAAYRGALVAAGEDRARLARAHLALGDVARTRRDAQTAGLHYRTSFDLAGSPAAERGARRAEGFCSVDVTRGPIMRRFSGWRAALEMADDARPALSAETDSEARLALCGHTACNLRRPSARRHSGPDVGGAHVGVYLPHGDRVLALDPVISLPTVRGCMPTAHIELGRQGAHHTIRAVGSAVAPIGIRGQNMEHCDLERDPDCSPMCLAGTQTIAVGRVDARGRGVLVRVQFSGEGAVFDPPIVLLKGDRILVSGCAPPSNIAVEAAR